MSIIDNTKTMRIDKFFQATVMILRPQNEASIVYIVYTQEAVGITIRYIFDFVRRAEALDCLSFIVLIASTVTEP